MTRFIDRKAELEMHNKMWASKEAEFLILCGRRRVGKTRLLTYWQETLGCSRVLNWVAEPTSSLDQFKRMLFWAISSPDTATPPALDALPGA